MRGSYVFKYDLWASFERPVWRNNSWRTVWSTIYFFRDRGIQANFGRPIGPISQQPGRGRGAMDGKLKVLGIPLYVVAVQTGVSQKDVVPFQITVPEYPDASVQGEYNCKTEEVYFGYVADSFPGGFSTRKPAKKKSGRS